MPPRAGVAPPPKTDLRREYAAAGYRETRSGPEALAVFDDEILRTLGPEAYRRSRNEPVIESAVEDLVISATSDEPILTPALSADDEGFELADEITTFCRDLWAGIENDPQETLEQLARTACYNGVAVGEQTFALDAGRYWVRAWKALEAGATAFVVDEYRNVLGLLTAKPGMRIQVGGALYSNADVVAREKFTVLTLRAEGADPRGRSLVASAMTARELKRRALSGWDRFLDRKSELIPVGTASEDSEPELPRDENGDPVEGAARITPAEAIAETLSFIGTHKSIGLPPGAKVETLDLQGDSDLYLNAVEFLDRQMTRSIMLQVLATSEAKHGTRAQASVHENVKDLVVFWLKQKLARMLRRDLFRVAVLVNYGPDAARRLTPLVTLGDYDRKDWAETADAVDALVKTLRGLGYTKAADELVASIGLSTERDEAAPDAPPMPPPVPEPEPALEENA